MANACTSTREINNRISDQKTNRSVQINFLFILKKKLLSETLITSPNESNNISLSLFLYSLIQTYILRSAVTLNE